MYQRTSETKRPIVLIVGPTATGKSDFGIEIARRWDGEILSADSMQIYRGMDIGTAKVTEAEMDGVRHHGLDLVDPKQSFTVADYQEYATETIDDIHRRGRLPIIVGGTGLYIRAIVEPLSFGAVTEDPDLRRQLRDEAMREGPEKIHARLAAVDPAAAIRISPADTRRVVRALEVYLLTGVPISYRQEADTHEYKYATVWFGLTLPRELLYERINDRVDRMIAAGLVEEVRRLNANGCDDRYQSMQAIGYKEVLAYLHGDWSLEQSVEVIKQSSRRYAKRQLSWFRRIPDIEWLDARTSRSDLPTVETRVAGITESRGE